VNTTGRDAVEVGAPAQSAAARHSGDDASHVVFEGKRDSRSFLFRTDRAFDGARLW
jgi:hypothetical protein